MRTLRENLSIAQPTYGLHPYLIYSWLTTFFLWWFLGGNVGCHAACVWGYGVYRASLTRLEDTAGERGV